MGNWKEHSGSYYNCNKYVEDTGAKKGGKTLSKEEASLMAKKELDRYLHYYERFQNHEGGIKFAATNWNDGTKNIYFCAYLNPRTLQLSFASIDEDKTGLYPMDESAWVNNKSWDVDLCNDSPADSLVTVD